MGGQWMKEYCDLDRDVENFAWCFDCVPEENSLLLQFGNVIIETPASILSFMNPKDYWEMQFRQDLVTSSLSGLIF
jgi:hypothetical protein